MVCKRFLASILSTLLVLSPIHSIASSNNSFSGSWESANRPFTIIPVTEPLAGVTEQFTLPIGATYYFDLSGEVGNIGTINTEVPDKTLHYVPFTYAGTVNAYSLDSSSSGNTGAAGAATASNRSLFVGEYNVGTSVSWNSLNSKNLIFGKTYDTNYKLRVLSAGSRTSNIPSAGRGGTPTTNEMDQILGKGDYIKNWRNIYTWGQDTYSTDKLARAVRGFSDAKKWNDYPATRSYVDTGWRPALEVLNPATLKTDGLKAVTLNLNGGQLKDSKNSINIVCAGTTFKAPSDKGLTAPTGKVFDKWQKTGDENTTYVSGSTITHTNGLELTALWYDPNVPVITSVRGNSTNWTKDNVTLIVTASDAGLALHDTAYSFDDGATWQVSNTKTFTENQTVKIKIRNKVGNISDTNTQAISKIDKTAPTISAITGNPTDWTDSDVTLTVNASDNGSGLHDLAYSFDDGVTWQA